MFEYQKQGPSREQILTFGGKLDEHRFNNQSELIPVYQLRLLTEPTRAVPNVLFVFYSGRIVS